MILMLNDVRLSFAEVFVPKAFEDGGEPAYSAVLIIDPKVTRAFEIGEAKKMTPVKLMDAVTKVAKDKWGAKTDGILAELIAKNRVCFMAGPKKNASGEAYSGFEGMYHISTRGKLRPLLLGKDKSPVTQQDGVIYSGCYVNASIEMWTQDNKWGKRVNASLRGAQFVRDGDAFGGGAPASTDEFEDLSVGGDSPNSLV